MSWNTGTMISRLSLKPQSKPETHFRLLLQKRRNS
ncbi:hypothetical protein [Vibrio phage 33Fb.4]|nr:hypothetical protein [Vibrio phage 31Fb.4]WAG58474.1 hypothetical protein [Vibrio phage 33Fb.4]